MPLAGRNREHPGPPGRQPRVAFGNLLAHVGDVEVGHLAGALEEGDRRLRLVGVDVNLERRFIANDENRVPQRLQPRQNSRSGQRPAGDDEVGAVAEARVLVVGPGQARWLVAGDRGRAAPSPRSPATTPAKISTRPWPPASTTPDSRSTSSCSGVRCHGLLAVGDRPLQHLGEDRVLLLLGDVVVEPLFVGLEVGELAGERVGHLAEDGQHRSLGRFAHRVVGGVGGAWQRRRRRAAGRPARPAAWPAPRPRRGRSG